MKILIAGSNGYVGSHLKKLLISLDKEVHCYNRSGVTESLESYDVVINCARPHWSEFDASEIYDQENQLLGQLDSFAKKDALKLHLSGVWLFAHSTTEQL